MKLTLLSEDCLLLEKAGVAYKYSCVMFEMPVDIAKAVIDWGNRNIKEEWVHHDPEDPSLGREDHIHVTVKYGLHSPDPNCIAGLIKNFGSFAVNIGEVSKFNTAPDYDVIKLSIESDKLHELNALIAKSTPITDKYPVYQPHLTVAYVKKGSCDHLLGRRDFDELTATCEKVQFSSKATDSKMFLPIC